jgi:virginiamycin B lyase
MRRHGWARRSLALVSTLAVALPLAGLIVSVTAPGAHAEISTFHAASISTPGEIVTGPDGALWFTNYGNNSIGRVTTAGAVTNFTHASIDNPYGITAGPDGALWFTNYGNNSIGRVTTAGAVTNFTDASIVTPNRIVTGSDGALWFTNQFDNTVGRITTSGTVTKFTDASINSPIGITSGPDGALWFTNYLGSSVGRITTAGVVTNFTDASIFRPYGIVTGSDGALWFTNSSSSIGRITTSGTISSYSDPSVTLSIDITAGPDGALWFYNYNLSSIGRITTSGNITTFPDARLTGVGLIATGPDGALWITNGPDNFVGRFGLPTLTDTCSVKESCVAAGGVAASAETPRVSVVVTGKPIGTPGKVTLKVAPGTLTCPTVLPGKRAVGTLRNIGFSKKTKLKLTVTLRHTTGTSPAQVCFRKKKPFKSQSPSTSNPGGGTGLLLACTATKNVAPCVRSSKAVGTSVVVTFVVPGGDPDFSIQWPAGSRQSWLSQFGQGRVGKRYTAKLQVRGGVAPYRWTKTSGRLPKNVKLDASKGVITGVPRAKGKYPIVVQATDAQNPKKKTKPEKIPIVINARR